MAEPKQSPVTPIKPLAEQNDYRLVELVHPIATSSATGRAQMVSTLRADTTTQFKEHPAGVEVLGKGAWTGVVPWSNIKVAKR